MPAERRFAILLLTALGGVLVALSLVAGHLNRVLLDTATFAAKVDEVRRDRSVAEAAGRELSKQLILANPDLVALRPLVDQVAIGVAGSEVLSGPVRAAAAQAHRVLTEPGSDTLVLRLADAGAVVAAAVAVAVPDRAPRAADAAVTLANVGDQAFAGTTIALARLVDVLAWLLPLLALVSFAGAVVLARDRWWAVGVIGTALVWAAAAVALVLVLGGLAVRRLDVEVLGGAVAGASWRVFVRPMWWSVLVVGGAGALVRGSLGAVVPVAARVRQWVRALWHRPGTPLGVVARAAVLGAIGVAVLVDPAGTLEVAARAGGLVLVLIALAEVARLVAAARPAASAAQRPTGPRHSWRPLLVAVVAAAVLLVGVVVLARPGRDASAAVVGAGEVCNGHAGLCDRAFTDVAYAASHNAMAVAREPGWFLAEQTDPIPGQLDLGVRALLIDVWAGRAAGDLVRTAEGSYAEAAAIVEQDLGPEVVAAARRLADSVAGVPEGPEARYLCHGLCETGATPFLDTLVEVRAWLATHPDEVVTLFVEDHVPAADIAADVEQAGLLPYVLTPPPVGEAWPTLADMIRSGRRLVVMLEEGEGGEAAPWLANGFRYTQDTPYTFPDAASFSCAANRGPADAPLLLVNHWLSGFGSLVTNAVEVNARDVLWPRVEQCRVERDRIPSFVAVNFVELGDLFGVVDELNGV